MWTRKFIEDYHGKNSIQRQNYIFHQHIGLKFREETTKMLNKEQFCMVCKTEYFAKYLNVALERNGEDQLEWRRENRR